MFAGCLTSPQHAGVSQGRVCSGKYTCCHTEIDVADQALYLTQANCSDTGPTSHSANPETPGACLFVGCLTSQQHASVSQGRICSENFTCCHTEIEVANQTFHLTQSQYTDTGPTSPSAVPKSAGAWQGSHSCSSFEVSGMSRRRIYNPVASGIGTRDLPLSRRTP